jgi:hypothetical protein
MIASEIFQFFEKIANDPFQVCELLRLPPVTRDMLRKFSSTCREEGVTPLQKLLDFMRVYSR